MTSAGFAGLAAVIAASIAAYQVSGTRADDRAAVQRDAASKRRDQLWQRFEWISASRTDLGAATSAKMLVALEKVARNEKDTNLVDIISAARLRTVRQSASRINSPSQ